MKVIHKFGPYEPSSDNVIMLENITGIVHFGEQFGGLFIWAEVDTTGNKERNIDLMIVGTGWEYSHKFAAIDSVVTKEGYVWHLLLGVY